ncbi:MAG: calcium-binding protein [Paracoccaceae bacterium]
MATIEYFSGNALFASPNATFDITSVVAKRVGAYVNYYSFNTDGTMFVLHTQTITAANGTLVPTIVGWDHIDGGTVLQSATTSLALQPFLTNLYSQNPSSSRAVNYFWGADDTLTGSADRDLMNGLNGNDQLSGLGGNDRLNGGNGNDTLDGGTGNDVLLGQAGNDHLTTSAGADALTGGAGADFFDFVSPSNGADRITDFTAGTDHITLASAAFAFTAPLVDGESFIAGTAATTAAATLLYTAATGALSYDADGTGAGAAQLIATLTNHATLTAADFLLI